MEDNERLMSKSVLVNIGGGNVCLIHDHPVRGFLYQPPPPRLIQKRCLLDFQGDGICFSPTLQPATSMNHFILLCTWVLFPDTINTEKKSSLYYQIIQDDE